jgi:hypothetical protein
MQAPIQHISVTKVRLKVNVLSAMLSSHFESQIGDRYQMSTTSKPELRKQCQKKRRKFSSVYKTNKS